MKSQSQAVIIYESGNSWERMTMLAPPIPVFQEWLYLSEAKKEKKDVKLPRNQQPTQLGRLS